MKKKITKEKIVLSLRPELINFLKHNFENKSQYVEYLIFQDMLKNDLIKNDIIIYDNR